MAGSGLIIRLKRGVYLVPPRIPAGGRWAVSEYFLLSRLMTILGGKYQISGLNAFNFYGFDDQVPNRIYVYNNRIFQDFESFDLDRAFELIAEMGFRINKE